MSSPDSHDRRRWPANARVAARELEGRIPAGRFTAGTWQYVARPAADLLDAPGGARDRQVLRGECLRVLEVHDGMAFVQAEKDLYTGYVAAAALSTGLAAPNARIARRHTLMWQTDSARAMAGGQLAFGARVHVIEVQDNGWSRTDAGFIPSHHLAPLDRPERDPVEVAARLLGLPYLWGANGHDGIDCSGLVQAACIACGIACPGDSDMQAAELGSLLPQEASLRRGDLLFWKGHVALVADPETILHANAHAMAVAFEGLQPAIARIAASDGPVTVRRRLPVLT